VCIATSRRDARRERIIPSCGGDCHFIEVGLYVAEKPSSNPKP
jgi:hypothetical protein